MWYQVMFAKLIISGRDDCLMAEVLWTRSSLSGSVCFCLTNQALACTISAHTFLRERTNLLDMMLLDALESLASSSRHQRLSSSSIFIAVALLNKSLSARGPDG